MMPVLVALLLFTAAKAAAQTLPPDHFKQPPPDSAAPALDIPEDRPPVTSLPAELAVLRGLDKMSGRVSTFEMRVGETRNYERLRLTLRACRVPPPDEPQDAFAWLEIRDPRVADPVFHGWMFASSPALSALDHPRYDVWVLSCRISSAEASGGSDQN